MKIFSAIFLSFLAFITVCLFIPKINGFGPHKVKQYYVDNQVYQQIHSFVDQQLVDNQALNQEPAAAALIRQTVTPDYIQHKLDTTLDQTSDWITGSSTDEPTISINDLKQQLIDNHPQGQQAVELLQQITTNTDLPTDQAPQLSADPQTQAALDQFLSDQPTIQSFSQGDFTIHLGSYLQPIRLAYNLYTIALFVLPILILIILALTIFTRPRKLHTAGLLLLFTGIGLGLLATISQLALINWLLPATYTQINQHFPLASSLTQAISQPLFHHYMAIHGLVALLCIILGLALYFFSRYHHKPTTASHSPLSDHNDPTSPGNTLDPTPDNSVPIQS